MLFDTGYYSINNIKMLSDEPEDMMQLQEHTLKMKKLKKN